VLLDAHVRTAVPHRHETQCGILATGGTIAGAAASGTQAGYTSGAVNIDAMIAAVPGIKDLANITGKQISNVGSQDMSFDILLKVAKRINELAKSKDVDGIVITHGTDTMEESAFFLNLTVKTDKPVVMVGSMRPSTAVSADGPLNLYNAVGVAADPNAKGRGVLVVMNDWIHGAHSLTKTSTTALQTFMSPLRGLVGVAAYGKNDFFSSPSWKHTTQSEFDHQRDAAAAWTLLPLEQFTGFIDCAGDEWRQRHRDRRRWKRQYEQGVGRRRCEGGKKGRGCRAELTRANGNSGQKCRGFGRQTGLHRIG
jgi:L-asparaginase type II